MALPIFTIQSFNQNALQAAGAVFVQRVESVSLLRNVVAETGGSIGGRSTTMEKKMEDLTKSLLSEIQAQTKAKYPTAVALVDFHIAFSDIGKTDQNVFLAGQASATALVRKSRKVPNSSMAPLASESVAPVGSVAPMAPMAPMAPPMAPPMPMPTPMSVPPVPMSVPPMAMAPPMAIPIQSGNAPVGGKRRSKKSKTRMTRKNK